MTMRDDLSEMAVGLITGAVVVVRGASLNKCKVVRGALPIEEPITSLRYFEGRKATLIAVSSNRASLFAVSEKDQEFITDEQGCELGCSAQTDQNEIVIGRKDGVFYYGNEGRGKCFALEGDKKFLCWFRSYLIVVTAERKPPNVVTNTVTIYDLNNKFIAYSDVKFPEIAHVITEWGTVFFVCKDGKVYSLEEKDTQTKLETLFRKYYFTIAINLAASQGDPALVADIYRLYGDHLYSKGDFAGAISQYLNTIGNLEPSYVIRKFLDAQRINNLTQYLHALHEKGLANADHTTLLLNCYTKNKDEARLDEFIARADEIVYDVETAIHVCRSAGYFAHALKLAERGRHHKLLLKILLDDVKDFERALKHIETLSLKEAEANLKIYGKSLASQLPDAVIDLLKRLCTGWINPVVNFASTTALYSENAAALSGIGAVVMDSGSASLSKAPAEEFIHVFVNQPKALIKFLEFVVEKNEATGMVYDTLLELYLSVGAAQSREKEEYLEKAFELLCDVRAQYNRNHALVLTQTHSFPKGTLYLYEQLGLYHEVVQHYMDKNQHDFVLLSCKKYGVKDRNLWVEALAYFAKKEGTVKEITEVLSSIERDNLIPPLLVIQILAERNTATLAVVRDYIIRRLQKENSVIREDDQTIRNLSEETEKMKTEIHELRTQAKIFQSAKCAVCTSPLDLPSIHFLCMHSYHKRCLDPENECPKCTPENEKILAINRSYEDHADQHEVFFKQLEAAQDGFETVAEYFGRRIFSKPKRQ